MVYSKGGGDAFTITVMVRAGSIHEPARLAGISHLLEHLLFKSQKRRINETVREHGAFINAATGKDWTRYHVSCAPDQYARFVDLLYDVVFVFAIDGEDVENLIQALYSVIKWILMTICHSHTLIVSVLNPYFSIIRVWLKPCKRQHFFVSILYISYT